MPDHCGMFTREELDAFRVKLFDEVIFVDWHTIYSGGFDWLKSGGFAWLIYIRKDTLWWEEGKDCNRQ